MDTLLVPTDDSQHANQLSDIYKKLVPCVQYAHAYTDATKAVFN